MARIPVGTTWWGKKWLDSLTGLDWENRLPRGRSYFNAGRVRSVEFDPEERVFSAWTRSRRIPR